MIERKTSNGPGCDVSGGYMRIGIHMRVVVRWGSLRPAIIKTVSDMGEADESVLGNSVISETAITRIISLFSTERY